MISNGVALAFAALLAAMQPAATNTPAEGEISKEQATSLLTKCGARKFEAVADVPSNGKVRRTKITLCAADSDTNEEWVSKLEKAVAQIEAHPTFPVETKAQLVSDLRAEIARSKSPQQAFDLGKSIDAADHSRGIARSAPGLAPVPRVTEKSPLAEFSALPPLPRNPVSSPITPKQPVAAGRPGPKLSVQCVVLGDDRAQRCGLISSDERLVVRATEAFEGPVRLRFSRVDSDATAEVVLASRSLKTGQTSRYAIPKEICAGRIRAKFEIEAVSPGTSGARLGPFETRCGT